MIALAVVWALGLPFMLRHVYTQYNAQFHDALDVTRALSCALLWPALWVGTCIRATWALFARGELP